jgi:hypothetical protein
MQYVRVLQKTALSACLPAVLGECASHLFELVQRQLVVLIDVHIFEEDLCLLCRDTESFEPFLLCCAELWHEQHSMWPVIKGIMVDGVPPFPPS